jgi:hypothetical protein
LKTLQEGHEEEPFPENSSPDGTDPFWNPGIFAEYRKATHGVAAGTGMRLSPRKKDNCPAFPYEREAGGIDVGGWHFNTVYGA